LRQPITVLIAHPQPTLGEFHVEPLVFRGLFTGKSNLEGCGDSLCYPGSRSDGRPLKRACTCSRPGVEAA